MSSKKRKEKQRAAADRRRREAERLKNAIEKQLANRPPPPQEVAEPADVQAPSRAQVQDRLEELLPRPEPPKDELWESFEEADLEGKVKIFLQTLESGKMDEEYAFEMLDDLHDKLNQSEQPGRTRYAELVSQLRQQAPEAYRKDRRYYHQNLISDAVADGRWEMIPELLSPFTEETNLDVYNQVIDQLKYHGLGQLLIQVMAQALPEISKNGDLFEWAKEEFSGELMRLQLWNYLETAESPRADDPALLEVTLPYGSWKAGWLERFVPRFTAKMPSNWQATDFGPTVDADQWEINLHDLLAEFVADRHWAGIPYGRADMAWESIALALTRQFNVPAGKGRKKGVKKEKSGGKTTHPAPAGSSLIPTYQAMDKTLVDLFPFLGGQPSKAAAAVELLPAYLHFLARLGLIHPSEMDLALRDLKPLVEHLQQPLRYYGADDRMIANALGAWSPGALAALQNDPALADARTKPLAIAEASQPQPPRRPGALQTYTFKVTYQQNQDVWRVIEIAESQTLDDLHDAIRDSVDFDYDHLYSFFMSGEAWDDSTEYASPLNREKGSASQVKIGGLSLRMKQRFLYLYDYGDEHRFDVQLIAINPDAPKMQYPRIIEKHGKNPPQYGGWDEEDDEEENEEEEL
jgi:hypothetical protein